MILKRNKKGLYHRLQDVERPKSLNEWLEIIRFEHEKQTKSNKSAKRLDR